YLPRKFKTAIAFPDDNCTDVYSNDLGFVVIPDGDSLAGFNVLVGGGLGMTHGKKVTYARLADPLGFATPEDVVQVAEAVITVQRDYGDRRDRRHARLKKTAATVVTPGSSISWTTAGSIGSGRRWSSGSAGHCGRPLPSGSAT